MTFAPKLKNYSYGKTYAINVKDWMFIARVAQSEQKHNLNKGKQMNTDALN